MKKLWLALLAVVALAYFVLSRPRAVGAGDPIDWSREPAQTSTDRRAFQVGSGEGAFTLLPRAAFDVSAKVVAAEHYRLDAGASLAPVDLVLTWGKLPEEPFGSQVSYQQMARYYFWHTSAAGLDLGYIQSHSSNMHMIPADDNVRRALLSVGGGDTVRVRGLLVNASRDDGFTWNSSLSRTDSGPGACELVWVEQIQVGLKLYR
jgi:hypothetical protein